MYGSLFSEALHRNINKRSSFIPFLNFVIKANYDQYELQYVKITDRDGNITFIHILSVGFSGTPLLCFYRVKYASMRQHKSTKQTTAEIYLM